MPITKASVLAELGFPADSHLFKLFEAGNYYLNYEGTEVYLDPKVGREAGVEYCYYRIKDDIYTFEERDLDGESRRIRICPFLYDLTPPEVAGELARSLQISPSYAGVGKYRDRKILVFS